MSQQQLSLQFEDIDCGWLGAREASDDFGAENFRFFIDCLVYHRIYPRIARLTFAMSRGAQVRGGADGSIAVLDGTLSA